MAKNISFKIFVILLLYLFPQINSDEPTIITFNKGSQTIKSYTDVNKVSYYVIVFKDNDNYYDGPNYLKIEIKTKSAPAPILCFSNIDFSCKTRQMLAKNPNGNSTFIWVRKEQYEDESSEPYFSVTCQEEKCSYDIVITGGLYASIKPDLVYSYLVTKKNTEMAFQLIELKEKRLTICIEGSYTAEIIINYENVFPNDNVKCVDAKINFDNDSRNFKVTKATEGDYITISIHQYDVIDDEENSLLHYGRAKENFALPNGPVITGFIYSGHASEECFPLSRELLLSHSDILFITGRIHNKYAWFYLEYEDGEYIIETDTEIIDGQLAFSFVNPRETRLICFEIPTTEDFFQNSVMFSFQIIDYDHINPFYEYTHPQISGQIYRRLLPIGAISYYYVAKSELSKGKYDYTLNNIKGTAKLYIDNECNDFPDCHYKKEDLYKLDKTTPVTINNHIIWYTSNDISSALGLNNNLMVVYCDENNEYNTDYCEFETSIFYKGQDISLIENQKMYKYILKDETGIIMADLKNNRIIERLTFDIMILSGDISFNVINQEIGEDAPEIKYYYLSNKIVINAYRPRKRLQKIMIEYKASVNSVFNIKYSVDNYDSEQYDEYLISGESYLVQINPLTQSKTKTIYMKNYYVDKTPLLINFFSLNCEFEINNNSIPFSDGYAQDYKEKGEGFYEELKGIYRYDIKIKDDFPNLREEVCGIYVAGIETDKNLVKDIVVPININQQIIFDDKFKKIRFSVPIINVYNDITYHVNVIDRAHYILNGYMNGKKMVQINNVTTAVTTTYYLYAGEIRSFCKENELCLFSLEIEYKEKIIETTDNPMIEIIFREVKNTPVYLQKGLAKLDYVCGDEIYYLYTDINRHDVAEISLNFIREFGYIWAKVVKKDLKEPEPEADWKNLYKLPGPDMENSLLYDTYTKKLIVTGEDTEECFNGCYLIMAIQVNDIGEYVPNLYYYYFSIIAKITPSHLYYIDIPKIVIQVDDYVIGSFNYEELQNKICSNFYEIWLPHDADKVEFDWQSTHANLYINIGSTRPSPDYSDFILSSPGRHSLLSLSKDEILYKAKLRGIIPQEGESIQDVNLVIGIWTDKKDSISSELYSLRIHEPELEGKLEIIPVNADQKVMCKPTQVEVGSNKLYRCYFMIIYDYDVAIFNPLFVYGNSINHGSNINLYANFIEKEVYDSYNEEVLRKNISTSENAQFNTYNEDAKYIYVSNIPWEYPNYLFVTLESDTKDELMLINSIPLYDPSSDESFTVFPNSFSEQILSCKGDIIKMTFPGNEDLITTINVINGEAEIKWENSNDIYYVKGIGEKINLISDKNNRNLIIRNLKPVDYSEDNMENPGFLFYISYKGRTEDLNFDEIKIGKSTSISYKNATLPLILYSKIEDSEYDDINIAINFKDNPLEISGDYNSFPIHITGSIMTEASLIKSKYNKYIDMIPYNFKEGIYYPGTKTGLLYFTKDEIKEYNINSTDNPSIYIRIDQEFSENPIKNQLNVEAQILGINYNKDIDNIIPLENKYYFASLAKEKDEIIYPLKLKKGKDFVRIQIAFNSPNLDFYINQNKTQIHNQRFEYSELEKYGGKIIFTFKKPDINMKKIYLHIFRKDPEEKEDFPSNYIFKYMNGESEKDFFDCIMASSKIKVEKNSDPNEPIFDIMKVTFNQIHTELEIANITYILKIVDSSNYLKNEEINTIAITESEPITMVYERNPLSYDDKITLTYKGKLSNWEYANIIAQIQQNNEVEYISYDGFTKNEYDEDTDDTDTDGTDSGHTDSDHPDTDHPDTDHPDTDHTDTDHTDSDHTDSDHPDTDHTDTDHTDIDHTDTDHTDTDHTDSDHTDSDHTDTDHTDSEHTDTDHTDSENKDDNNNKLVLAIVIPIASLIVIITILFVVLRCRKQKDITKEDIEKLNAYELV